MSDSFSTPWTVAHQALLSMEFSRQEYWSRLPFPPPEDLPNPGIELASLAFPVLTGGFFITSPTRKTQVRSWGWEDPLEEEMATQSSILAWRIPWTEETGGLWSMGSKRVGYD